MENKIKFGNSIKKMSELIKKSRGMFWSIVLLMIIPLLIINCYSFYSAYNGTSIDYSQIEKIDFQTEIFSGNFNGIYNAFNSVITFPDFEQNATDLIFEVVNFIISAFFDAIIIILAVQLFFDRRFKTGDLAKTSIKRLFPAVIFGFFGTWILTEVQSLIFSSTEYVMIFAHLASKGTSEALIMLGSAIFSSAVQAFVAILLASMGIMLVSYMTIPVVSGRCKGVLIAPQYAFEVLRKNIWRQTFHIMPFVIVGYIFPSIMQIVAIFLSSSMAIAIVLTAISVVIQFVFCGLLWMFMVPDFFALEEKSGIQTKIKEMMEKAMRDFENARSARQQVKEDEKQKEENNNKSVDNTDDKIAEDEQNNDK